MSRGLSPSLPLTKDPQDGHKMNKSYVDMVRQNIKMLVLTAPGERMMDPLFGVGLRNYLFRNNVPELQAEIRAKITQQIRKYMPFIELQEMKFNDLDMDRNVLNILVSYRIVPLDVISSIEINTAAN
jgi:uncharacterized protein